MNLLGLVFGILFILSYGYLATWDKHRLAQQVQNRYLSHQLAQRKILNRYESEIYNALSSVKKDSEKKSSPPKNETSETPVPSWNRECSRINLWPLIQEGREKHPLLYQISAKLLREFYSFLKEEKTKFEYQFLDELLSCAKKQIQEESFFSLEKVHLSSLKTQKIYYKMLKGSKKWDLKKGLGFPPLLEYIKAKPSSEKLCLFHANQDMLTVLFNPSLAEKLQTLVHQRKKALLTKELVERLAIESHIVRLDPDLLDLLQFSGYFEHREKKKIFVADEDGVFLRKHLSI